MVRGSAKRKSAKVFRKNETVWESREREAAESSEKSAGIMAPAGEFWGAYLRVSFFLSIQSIQSHLFPSPIGARTLKVPVPYSSPNVESYTWTPSHNHSCSDVGAQITSLRSDDLVGPKPPACGCE